MEVSTVDKNSLSDMYNKLRKTKKSIRNVILLSYKKKKKIFKIS